ncbi:Protein SPA2 [Yarrowia sp. B02]|nr:Protein SPA2 [Yarrowia sp. B02]
MVQSAEGTQAGFHTVETTMDDLVTHHGSLKQFLQTEKQESDIKRSASSSARVHKAREKLLKLSPLQFAELSTDVYDELQRRQGLSYEAQDFLAPRANFHPKRNQARQKLSTLPASRFRDLASDIQYEIERRHEEAGIPAHAIGGLDDHTMGHAVDVPMHVPTNIDADSSFEVTNQPLTYDANYGVAVGELPAIHVDDSHVHIDDSHVTEQTEHERAPSQQSERSFPESGTLQSKTLIPHKSTLVEETDSEEETDDEHTATPAAYAQEQTQHRTDHARNVSQTSSEHSIGNKAPTYDLNTAPRDLNAHSHSFHPETIHPEDVDSSKVIDSPDLDDDELLGGSTHTQVGYTHAPTPNDFDSTPNEFDSTPNEFGPTPNESGFGASRGVDSVPSSAETEELQTKLLDAENMSKSLMEENEQLHEFIKSLEAEKARLVETCNAQVETLEEEKAQLHEIIGTRDIDLEDLRGRHETLVDKQTTLDDSHASLSTRVGSLEAELELKEVELEKLQGELQQVSIEHKNELESVRKEAAKSSLLGAGVGAGAGVAASALSGSRERTLDKGIDYDRLPSISPDTSIDKSMPAVEDMDSEAILSLQNQLREQREKTSEVKKQAAVFLAEMKSLAAKSHDHEVALKQINELKAEIEQWKARYSKTKATVRSLRSSVYGTSGIVQPAIESTNPFVDEVHGLVEDVSLTKFQLAMDEYLLKSRDVGSDHSELLQHLHRVIVATRKVTDDSNDVSTEGGARDYRTPLLSNLYSIVSKTANQLITCTKNHATSSGLLPIYLLDASVANLACAVIELVKVAKIRSENGEKRALTREGLGLALGGSTGNGSSTRNASVSSASASGNSNHTPLRAGLSGAAAGGVSFDSYPLSPSSPGSLGQRDGLTPPHMQTRSGSFSSTEGPAMESPIKTPSKGNSRLRTLRLVSAPSSLRDKNKKREDDASDMSREPSNELSELSGELKSELNGKSESLAEDKRDPVSPSSQVAELNVPKVRSRDVSESTEPLSTHSTHSTYSTHSTEPLATKSESTEPLAKSLSTEPLASKEYTERLASETKSTEPPASKESTEPLSFSGKADKEAQGSGSANGFGGAFGGVVGAVTAGVAALSFGQKKKDESKDVQPEDFEPRNLDLEFKPRDLDAELQPRDLDAELDAELDFQPRDLDAETGIPSEPRDLDAETGLDMQSESRALDQDRLLEKAREMNHAREHGEDVEQAEDNYTVGQNVYSGSNKDYFDTHPHSEEGPAEPVSHEGPLHEIQRYDYVTAQELRAAEKRAAEEARAHEHEDDEGHEGDNERELHGESHDMDPHGEPHADMDPHFEPVEKSRGLETRGLEFSKSPVDYSEPRGVEAHNHELSTAAMAATAVVGASMAGTGVASALGKSYASPAIASPALDSPAASTSSPGAFHPQESFDPQATFELPSALREAVSQSPDISHVSNMSETQDDTELTQMSDDPARGVDSKSREDYDTLLGGEDYDNHSTPLTHSVSSLQDAPQPRESLTSEISEVDAEHVPPVKVIQHQFEGHSEEIESGEDGSELESSEEEDSEEDDEDDEDDDSESEDEQVIAADLGIYLPKAVKFDGEDPDNTVEDLQYYLEEQCVEVIEAIQNLLTAIKGNSNMIAISAHSRAICKVVLCMVDATSQSMSQTRNHLLKENGTWICQDLRACTDRMKMIFKDDKFVKPGAEYPPKQFKQRLAGLSFDLTKCTKELVKTVEEVSLQTEIGEIDRQIAHN